MASQTVPKPHKPDPIAGSPSCSDPNCEYCKELRMAQDSLKEQRGYST